MRFLFLTKFVNLFLGISNIVIYIALCWDRIVLYITAVKRYWGCQINCEEWGGWKWRQDAVGNWDIIKRELIVSLLIE